MYATEDIIENGSVLNTASELQSNGIKKLDSLHIACAIYACADYFLTTDDRILKKTTLIEDIRITDPIGFIKEVLA